MKLYATVTSDEGSRPAKKGSNRQINMELMVGNDKIGDIELLLLTQDETDDTVDEIEWLLNYYHCGNCDPYIIAQGHLPK